MAEDPELEKVLSAYRALGEEPGAPPIPRLARLREGHRTPTRGLGTTRGLAAAALVAISFVLGWSVRNPSSDLEQRVALLEQQAAERDLEILLAALTETTASQRIAALRRLTRRSESIDAGDWIRRILSEDPSVNVRLAAVDCLYELPEPPTLDARALRREPSALIRLALLDWLASARPPEWHEHVADVMEHDEDQQVREKARWLLAPSV